MGGSAAHLRLVAKNRLKRGIRQTKVTAAKHWPLFYAILCGVALEPIVNKQVNGVYGHWKDVTSMFHDSLCFLGDSFRALWGWTRAKKNARAPKLLASTYEDTFLQAMNGCKFVCATQQPTSDVYKALGAFAPDGHLKVRTVHMRTPQQVQSS